MRCQSRLDSILKIDRNAINIYFDEKKDNKVLSLLY